LEKQFSDQFFDTVFDEIAQHQYLRELTFSTCAKVMSQVTFGRAASVNAAYLKDSESIPVSIVSLYDKLRHIEPVVCEELVRRSSADLTVVVGLLAKRDEPIPGFRLRFLRFGDGNVLACSEHRLKELRNLGAAAMPGLNLVLYDYSTDLITDVVACEDGLRRWPGQRTSLVPSALGQDQQGRLDRGGSQFQHGGDADRRGRPRGGFCHSASQTVDPDPPNGLGPGVRPVQHRQSVRTICASEDGSWLAVPVDHHRTGQTAQRRWPQSAVADQSAEAKSDGSQAGELVFETLDH
jgi:hypothetical protein